MKTDIIWTELRRKKAIQVDVPDDILDSFDRDKAQAWLIQQLDDGEFEGFDVRVGDVDFIVELEDMEPSS